MRLQCGIYVGVGAEWLLCLCVTALIIYGDLWCCRFAPIWFDWTYGVAVWHLWAASIIYGDLWCCKFTPVGLDWTYGIAVWHLWGASIIYGGLWCCRFTPKESAWTYGIAVLHQWETISHWLLSMGKSIFVYGAAVSDLWGTYGITPLRSYK